MSIWNLIFAYSSIFFLSNEILWLCSHENRSIFFCYVNDKTCFSIHSRCMDMDTSALSFLCIFFSRCCQSLVASCWSTYFTYKHERFMTIHCREENKKIDRWTQNSEHSIPVDFILEHNARVNITRLLRLTLIHSFCCHAKIYANTYKVFECTRAGQ